MSRVQSCNDGLDEDMLRFELNTFANWYVRSDNVGEEWMGRRIRRTLLVHCDLDEWKAGVVEKGVGTTTAKSNFRAKGKILSATNKLHLLTRIHTHDPTLPSVQQ